MRLATELSVGAEFERESCAICADANTRPTQLGFRGAAERALAGAPLAASKRRDTTSDALSKFALDVGDPDVKRLEETFHR